MFNFDLLGWKKGHSDLGDHTTEEFHTLEDHKRHDVVVETVLESAKKKAKEENVPVGEDFYLPLADVDVEVDGIDLDIALPMKARRHGLLHIRTDEDDSLRFERLACE